MHITTRTRNVQHKSFRFTCCLQGTGGSSSVGDGVRIEELLEHATAALHILARDKQNRMNIRALSTVPLVVSV